MILSPFTSSYGQEVGVVGGTYIENMFHLDSYLLTTKGEEALNKFSTTLKQSGNTVNSISISAHAVRGKQSKVRDEMMFILTMNRAYVVKSFLKERLDQSVEFRIYGCGDRLHPNESEVKSTFSMKENRVEINVNKEMPLAKATQTVLTRETGVYPKDAIIPNEVMKKNILTLIDSYYHNEMTRDIIKNISMSQAKTTNTPEYLKKIPAEFWVSTEYSVSHGEDDPNSFKEKVEKLFGKLNKRFKIEVPVDVFFHDNLKEALYSL